MALGHQIDYARFDRGMKLMYSDDNGKSWFYHNGKRYDADKTANKDTTFFWHEQDDYPKERPFCSTHFVQRGQGYRDATDEYINIYANGNTNPQDKNNRWNQFDWKLELARVGKNHVLDKSRWEYFHDYASDGNATWTEDVSQLSQTSLRLLGRRKDVPNTRCRHCSRYLEMDERVEPHGRGAQRTTGNVHRDRLEFVGESRQSNSAPDLTARRRRLAARGVLLGVHSLDLGPKIVFNNRPPETQFGS